MVEVNLKSMVSALLSEKVILILITISLFIAIWHLQSIAYEIVPNYVNLQMKQLDGQRVVYVEPNNIGSVIMTYPLMKLTGISSETIIRTWKMVAFMGFLIVFYLLTKSFKLTILNFAYAPTIINIFVCDVAASMFLYILAIYLFVNNKKVYAYLCSIPLVMFRHEALVVFAGFLLYDFIERESIYNFIKRNALNVFICFVAAGIYLYGQYYFYGSPFANFMLNVSGTIKLSEFPLYVYVIRYSLLFVMAVTSLLLFKKDKILFILNTMLTLTYTYFALFGFDYAIFAVQVYYGWMFQYTIIALAYYAGEYDGVKVFK